MIPCGLSEFQLKQGTVELLSVVLNYRERLTCLLTEFLWNADSAELTTYPG